jgi:hypothetical protein
MASFCLFETRQMDVFSIAVWELEHKDEKRVRGRRTIKLAASSLRPCD